VYRLGPSAARPYKAIVKLFLEAKHRFESLAEIDCGDFRSGKHFTGLLLESQMASLHRVRGPEPDSIGFYELVPYDDVFAQAGCKGLKASENRVTMLN
jgi:hypothetical protein